MDFVVVELGTEEVSVLLPEIEAEIGVIALGAGAGAVAVLDDLGDVSAPADTVAGKLLGTTGTGQWGPVDPVSGGVTDHAQLSGRASADQHPISAVAGLQAALTALEHLRVYEGPATDSPSPADYDVWIVTP